MGSSSTPLSLCGQCSPVKSLRTCTESFTSSLRRYFCFLVNGLRWTPLHFALLDRFAFEHPLHLLHSGCPSLTNRNAPWEVWDVSHGSRHLRVQPKGTHPFARLLPLNSHHRFSFNKMPKTLSPTGCALWRVSLIQKISHWISLVRHCKTPRLFPRLVSFSSLTLYETDSRWHCHFSGSQVSCRPGLFCWCSRRSLTTKNSTNFLMSLATSWRKDYALMFVTKYPVH